MWFVGIVFLFFNMYDTAIIVFLGAIYLKD